MRDGVILVPHWHGDSFHSLFETRIDPASRSVSNPSNEAKLKSADTRIVFGSTDSILTDFAIMRIKAKFRRKMTEASLAARLIITRVSLRQARDGRPCRQFDLLLRSPTLPLA